jgi:putative hydroxymethylpyrimidine transport system substrate-binding protein
MRTPHMPALRTTHPLRRQAALLIILAAFALAGCGTKKDVISAPGAKPFTVMLDFFPNADHAALYAAMAHGDFRQVGLDVHPQTPADPSEPLKLLAAGRVDAAISYEPEVLLARDHGLGVVSIAALIQRPLTSIIALPRSHVRGVADLAGKSVGTAGIAYQSAELHSALRAAHVPASSVKEVNVGFNLVPAMLSGRVAATLGGFWNYEAIQLQQMGKHPLTIPVDRAGVPRYDELVIAVRADEARKRGQDLRAFLQALTRGQREVRAAPEQAVGLVLAANPSLSRKLQLASIRQTLPATLPGSGRPYGWQDPVAWRSFASWMFTNGLLAKDPGAGQPPLTNEFLPGEGI